MATNKPKKSAWDEAVGFLGNTANNLFKGASQAVSNFGKNPNVQQAAKVFQQTQRYTQPFTGGANLTFDLFDTAKKSPQFKAFQQTPVGMELNQKGQQFRKNVLIPTGVEDFARGLPFGIERMKGSVTSGLGVGLRGMSDMVTSMPVGATPQEMIQSTVRGMLPSQLKQYVPEPAFIGGVKKPTLQQLANQAGIKDLDLTAGLSGWLKNAGDEKVKRTEAEANKALADLPKIADRGFWENIKNPRWVARGLSMNAPSFVGSLGVGIGVGFLTKNPYVAVAASGGSSFLQNAGDTYVEAKANGADEKTAQQSAQIVGVINGMLDSVGIGKILNQSTKPVRGIVVSKLIKSLGTNMTLEGSTESVQQIISNVTAKTLYDFDRGLFDQVAESGFFGSILGGGGSLATDVGMGVMSGEPARMTEPGPNLLQPEPLGAEPVVPESIQGAEAVQQPVKSPVQDPRVIEAIEFLKTANPAALESARGKAYEQAVRTIAEPIFGPEIARNAEIPALVREIEKMPDFQEARAARQAEADAINPDLIAKTTAPTDAEQALSKEAGIAEKEELRTGPVANAGAFMSSEEAQTALKSLLSNEEIKFMGLDKINTGDGRSAEGKYYDAVVQVVRDPNGRIEDKTLYHEAWHAYVDMFVEKELYQGALQEIKGQQNIANDTAANEALAEGFAEFRAGRATFTGRILGLFQDMLYGIQKMMGKQSQVQDMYRDLAAGRGTNELAAPSGIQVGITSAQAASVTADILDKGMKQFASGDIDGGLETLQQVTKTTAAEFNAFLEAEGVDVRRLETDTHGLYFGTPEPSFWMNVGKETEAQAVKAVAQFAKAHGQESFITAGRSNKADATPGLTLAFGRQLTNNEVLAIEEIANNNGIGLTLNQATGEAKAYNVNEFDSMNPDEFRQAAFKVRDALNQNGFEFLSRLDNYDTKVYHNAQYDGLIDGQIQPGSPESGQIGADTRRFGPGSDAPEFRSPESEPGGGIGARGTGVSEATETAPTKRIRREPNPEVRIGAQAYAERLGLPQIVENHYVPVNASRAQQIAQAYEAMPEIDESPETLQAYTALAREVQDQWDYATQDLGIVFEPWRQDGQPYQNSAEMVADVKGNKHLYFFTGGEEHPLLGRPDAEGLSLNDKFRAIHDLFGHAAEGYGFGPKGEENAWIKHSQMFTPNAQAALTTETRGQNSWVNFGPNSNLPVDQRPYAPQKVGLLPPEFRDWQGALNTEQELFDPNSAPQFRTKQAKPEQPEGLKTPIGTIETAELYRRANTKSRFKDAYRAELTRRGLDPDNQEGPPKERGFVESVRQTESNRQAVREGVQGTYDMESDEGRIQFGREYIAQNPEEARKRVLSRKEALTNELSGIAFALYEDLQAKADAAEQAGNINEAKALDDQTIEIANKMAEKLTPVAQVLQFAHVFSKKTPQAMVRWAESLYEQANQLSNLSPLRLGKRLTGGQWELQLSPEKKQYILNQTIKIQRITDPAQRVAATTALMREIGKDIPPSVLQYTDAYRYQNMLINPLTQLRNIYGNALNATVLRPATLGAQAVVEAAGVPFGKKRTTKFSDVPKYYRNMIASTGNAQMEFARAWQGLESINGKLTDTVEFTPYQAVTNENLPKLLTVAGRLLEGTDRMFTELIAGAEYNRLLESGMEMRKAKIEAYETAAKWLYRARIDPHNTSGQGVMLSKIDGLTDWIIKGRKYFGPIGWFVPFVRVPMAVAKMSLEYNPITGPVTLVGNAHKSEQIAKMGIGATAMLAGATLAAAGKTNWEPPKDEKARTAFYDSGRRPFSFYMEVPGTNTGRWIPFQYLGPLGLMMAIPAASKYYSDDSPTAPTDGAGEKMFKIAMSSLNYFSAATPVSGLGGFVNAAQGEQDYSVVKNIAFTLGQLMPANGLVSYVANVLDPVYRKAGGDGPLEQMYQQWQKGIPILSKQLPSYERGDGSDSPRTLSSYILPYTLGGGAVIEGSGELLQLRKNQLQANAIDNHNEKQLEKMMSGESGDASNFKGDGTKGFGERLEKTLAPDKTNYSSYSPEAVAKMKRSHDFTYLRKLRDSAEEMGLPDETLAAEFKRKGVSADDLVYDDKTAMADDLQFDQIKTEIDGLQGDDLITKLMTMRVISEGTRKALLTDTLIGKLNKEGLIGDDLAKYLKTVGWDPKKKSFTTIAGSGGGGKSKKADLTFDAIKYNVDRPQLKLSGPPQISGNWLPTRVSGKKIQIPRMKNPYVQAPQGVRIQSPQIRPMATTLSGLGR